MVLDTNIVSFLLKGKPEAQLYRPHLTGRALYIAFMTSAELYRWPLENNWGERRIIEMKSHLRNYAVLPYDDLLAWRWAELMAAFKKIGRGVSFNDSWIAATALRHQMPLVTHNRRHFDGIPGLNIVSENRENA